MTTLQAQAQACFDDFCTPSKSGRVAEADQAALEAAKSKLTSFERQDYRIKAHNSPDGEVLLASYIKAPKEPQAEAWLVHGWSAHSAAMLGFVGPLVRLGYRVRLFDLPGHGASSGDFCSAPLTALCLHHLCGELGAPKLLVTHSFASLAGAFAVAGLSKEATNPMSDTALVTIAGLSDIKKETIRFARAYGLTDEATAIKLHLLEEHAGIPLGSLDAATRLANSQQPILAIHSQDDDKIDFKESFTASPNLPEQAERLKLESGGHQKLLFLPSVIKAVSGFSAKAL